MDLDNFLSQKGLVIKSPSKKEIIERAREISPKKLKILYGETYDECGEPIDSLKHYFFVANLAEILEKEGIQSEPTILVADEAVSHNEINIPYEEVINMGKKRASLIKKINDVYSTNLKVIFMSDFINSQESKQKLDKVKVLCSDNEDIQKLLEQTVPDDKVEIEKQKGFQYSLEEIATILDFDIKIGPPREKVYDRIAGAIADKMGYKKLMPIYLTPSFPLGLDFDYFFSNPEIEEYGVTAYKADSKGLKDNRIILMKTNCDHLKKLIEKTYIPGREFKDLPNPLLDLLILSETAKQRLENKKEQIPYFDDFYNNKLSDEELKNKSFSQINEFILSKIKEY